jgi:hypothetical protein
LEEGPQNPEESRDFAEAPCAPAKGNTSEKSKKSGSGNSPKPTGGNMPSKKAGSLSLHIEAQVEEVRGMNLGEVRELLWRYLDDRVQNAREARAIIKSANARISDIRKGLHLAEPHRVRELIGR